MPSKKPKKGSFAAEMAELLNSRQVKERDIDDDVMPEVDDDEGWKDALLGDDDDAAAPKRLKMRGALILDKKYQGKVVDKDGAFNQFSDDDELDEEMEEEEDFEGDEEEDFEEDEEELEQESPSDASKKPLAYDDKEALAALSDDDEDEWGIVGRDNKVNEAAISAKMDDIFGGLEDDSEVEGDDEDYDKFVQMQAELRRKKPRKKMKRLAEDFEDIADGDDAVASDEEEDEMMKQLELIRKANDNRTTETIKIVDDDVNRSVAAKNQMEIWSKLVGCRIHLQKPLTLAARFPSFYATDDFFRPDSELSEARKELQSSLMDTISSLHDLRQGMLESNKSLYSSKHLPIPKNIEKDAPNHLDKYWRLVSASSSQVSSKIDTALDYWYERAQLQTSTKQIGSEPATTQIRNALSRENERYLSRSQKNRTGKLPFGHPDSAKSAAIVSSSDFLSNSEIYDDSDYYSWLLNDYMHNSADSKNTEYNEELTDAQRLAKDPGRLLVDKKRSKARKLSLEVHDKLIGFATPIPQDAPSMIDALYKGLFVAP
eukprot:TRINITY_DN18010_c0_g1_i1.p1 TRINITY_DN18010_c0_g1~~TRINITY_DN18010_c0_g1_i1.p1  ORF type:complete len:544 (+),score=168.84 TRINITY_DN18010_c0_g1_i1:33-1664(+)